MTFKFEFYPKFALSNFKRIWQMAAQIGSGRVGLKPTISPKQLKIEQKLLLTAYIKSHTDFRLPPKCMTLNDLWARFKVTDTSDAAKFGLVMAPTPGTVSGTLDALSLLGLRIHALMQREHPKFYYVKVGIATSISPKRLKIWAKVTIDGLYKSCTRAFDCRQNEWPWMTSERDSRSLIL